MNTPTVPPPTILDAFYKLMATDPANLPKAGQIVVAQVCDLFLTHSEKHNEKATYVWYKHFLQSFSTLYGRIAATERKPFHVTKWLDANTPRLCHDRLVYRRSVVIRRPCPARRLNA